MRNGCPSVTMTFLFTDIEGSTRQWEESPEMYDRVEQHFAVLRAAVDDGRGEVFATMGDGIAAAFTSVEGALRAAIAAQQAMPATGLVVRMGIHTGEVERVGDDFRGRAVNRAARIMAVGHGGQILLSDVSAALVRAGTGRAELGDLGTHRLRDLTEPERVWQVVHPDLAQQFPPVRGVDTYSNNLPAQRSSLVGRDLEVQRLVAMTSAPPDRHADRGRRGRQDPPRRPGRRRPADRVRRPCGSSSWRVSPIPTTSPTRSPGPSAPSVARPAGRGRRGARRATAPARARQLRARRGQRGRRCRRAHGGMPRAVGGGDQPRGARARR